MDDTQNQEHHKLATQSDINTQQGTLTNTLVVSIRGLSAEKKKYLRFLARDVDTGRAEVHSGITSAILHSWRQEKAFQRLEAHVLTNAAAIGPELAKDLMSSSSALVAEVMVEDALSDSRSSQRAREAVLEGAGVLGAKGPAGNQAPMQIFQQMFVAYQGQTQQAKVIDTHVEIGKQ